MSVHCFTLETAAEAAEAEAAAAEAAAEAEAEAEAALGVPSPLRVSAAAKAAGYNRCRNLVAHRLVVFPAVLLLRGRHSDRSDQGASR